MGGWGVSRTASGLRALDTLPIRASSFPFHNSRPFITPDRKDVYFLKIKLYIKGPTNSIHLNRYNVVYCVGLVGKLLALTLSSG